MVDIVVLKIRAYKEWVTDFCLKLCWKEKVWPHRYFFLWIVKISNISNALTFFCRLISLLKHCYGARMGVKWVLIVYFQLPILKIEVWGYSGPCFWNFRHSAGHKKQELISMFVYLLVCFYFKHSISSFLTVTTKRLKFKMACSHFVLAFSCKLL